jgi:hypothetical protein
MDKIKDMSEQTIWEKREEFEDGSYKTIRVEKVSNGFIKCVTSYKPEGEKAYKSEKSIHEENPLEEMSVLDKLKSYLKDD